MVDCEQHHHVCSKVAMRYSETRLSVSNGSVRSKHFPGALSLDRLKRFDAFENKYNNWHLVLVLGLWS